MFRKLLMAGLCAMMLSAGTAAFAADVYVTPKGKKYHKADCRMLKNKEAVKMDEDEAIAQGLKPCGICLKDESKGAKSQKTTKTSAESKKKKDK